MSAPNPGRIAALGIAARRGFGRLTPEPFVIAVLLTALVAGASLLALLVTGEGLSPAEASARLLGRWHSDGGLWGLLTFGMQASLMLVLGGALAAAPPIRRGLRGLATWPRSPRGLVALTAGLSLFAAVINWTVGLIGGAFFARAAGIEAHRRGWRLHYPLLCAAGYSGMMVWHGGLSGTAPLKATTAGDMREILGPELAAAVGTIPLSESLLGGLNLVVTGGLLVLGPLLFAMLTPAPGGDPGATAIPEAIRREAASSTLEENAERAETGGDLAPVGAVAPSLDALERSPWILALLAAPMLGALGLFIAEGGLLRLDLNTVNLALWLLVILLYRRPDRLLAACEAGIRGCAGIFLLFPLYAGIIGMLAVSGLSQVLAGLFVEVSGGLFAILTFVVAGLLNLFVPSGGGQWAIQGPILCEAALARGVAPADAMMAMAYGDQWSNMLQPFWALPLLAITGVRAREIVGYCGLWMAVGGLWIALCLALMV